MLLPLLSAILLNICLNAGEMEFSYLVQDLMHFYILFSLQYKLYNMTIQFRIINIYNNNYAPAITHSMLWRMA